MFEDNGRVKAIRLKNELSEGFIMPIKHLVTPIRWQECNVGDVVFCKVRGACVTHKVYAIDSNKGCLIGNNKGHMNRWTKNVYGLAHKI